MQEGDLQEKSQVESMQGKSLVLPYYLLLNVLTLGTSRSYREVRYLPEVRTRYLLYGIAHSHTTLKEGIEQ